MTQVNEAGSLHVLIPRLKEESGLLEANIATLQSTYQGLNQCCSELWQEVKALSAKISDQEQVLVSLSSEIATVEAHLDRLRCERDRMKEDIDVAKAVTGLIGNPFILSEDAFVALIRSITSLWSLLNGTSLRLIS